MLDARGRRTVYVFDMKKGIRDRDKHKIRNRDTRESSWKEGIKVP